MVTGVTIAGRYRLEREIGRGGMGAVWLGHDEVLLRRVAVKRLGKDVGAAEEGYLRAQREARIAATLAHPHIVSVLDLVTEGEQQWLVMEYVEGENLSDLVRRKGPLPPDRVAAVIAQVAGALTAAHDRGIVHRDIKPSNLLVDVSGAAKVNDFGIARTADDDVLTQTGLIIGSPAYLAPEVVSGRTATSASDVWSLGATAYFALTGTSAYESDGNLVGLLHRIATEPPPRTARAGWLAPLLAHTMVLEPAERWGTREIADFLRLGPDAALEHTQAIASGPVPDVEAGREPDPEPEPEPHPPADPTPPASERPMAAAVAAAAAPPTPPARRTSRRAARRTGRVGNAVLAVLVVLLIAVIGLGWLVWSQLGADDDPVATTSTPPASATTTDTTPTPTPTPTPSASAMSDFVRDYLATATSDPAASWAMLTPGFQSQSRSFDSYKKTWEERPRAVLSDVVADPETLEVSYHVDYLDEDGAELFDDDVTLRLSFADGTYLIAGERA